MTKNANDFFYKMAKNRKIIKNTVLTISYTDFGINEISQTQLVMEIPGPVNRFQVVITRKVLP